MAGGTVEGMAVIEVAPERCPNGHQLGPNKVIVGWQPCQCVEGRAGHRTYMPHLPGDHVRAAAHAIDDEPTAPP